MKQIGWTIITIAGASIIAEFWLQTTWLAWSAIPFATAGALLIFETDRKNQ